MLIAYASRNKDKATTENFEILTFCKKTLFGVSCKNELPDYWPSDLSKCSFKAKTTFLVK